LTPVSAQGPKEDQNCRCRTFQVGSALPADWMRPVTQRHRNAACEVEQPLALPLPILDNPVHLLSNSRSCFVSGLTSSWQLIVVRFAMTHVRNDRQLTASSLKERAAAERPPRPLYFRHACSA